MGVRETSDPELGLLRSLPQQAAGESRTRSYDDMKTPPTAAQAVEKGYLVSNATTQIQSKDHARQKSNSN